MYMLIMVLDDSARLNDVLSAWVEAGVKGVTILESTGVNRVLPRPSAGPMYAGFSQIFGSGRVGHNTIFAVIDDLETAEAAVAATEAVLGDLTKPHTGIIFALPVVQTWGMPEPYAGEE
ncbi:MAG: hypothetical protein ACE5E7_08505 [Anaerolineae bacterium]